MNYRHAYHAGNHADVLKHIIVARIIEHLQKKPAPFRVLDAHAGIGCYGLESLESQKTVEWREGVGRLYTPDGVSLHLSPEAEALMVPWREAVRGVNNQGSLANYPGSPELIDRMVRATDKISLNELHPADYETLAARYGQIKQTQLYHLDALAFLKAQLPPPERRGLILIDPPYERVDEAERVLVMLTESLKRFATGIYCLWYPVTGDGLDQRLRDSVAALNLEKVLDIQLHVRAARRDGGLSGSGMIIINPPWRLSEEMRILLPDLCARLAQGAGAFYHEGGVV